MNFFIKSICGPLTILYVLSPVNVDGRKLSAITHKDTWSVSRTYFEESNSDPPDESDEALADPLVRMRLCEEITQSGAFAQFALHPISTDDNLYKLLERRGEPSVRRWLATIVQPGGLDVLDQIYNPDKHSTHEYTNAYKMRQVDVTKYFPGEFKDSVDHSRTEHVFVCLLKDEKSNLLSPLFVSKEYNVNSKLQAHRFAFLKWKHPDYEDDEYRNTLMIVEKSAEIYQEPNFDVEHHYLEVRKSRRPAATAKYDPVCKTNIQPPGYDQFFRLCAIIFSSSYFKERGVSYARPVSYNRDFEVEIGFKSEEHRKAASTKQHLERTLECWVNMERGDVKLYNVSRAYNSHQVFVYVKNKTDEKIYLEGLFTGVSIIREKRDFGFPPN